MDELYPSLCNLRVRECETESEQEQRLKDWVRNLSTAEPLVIQNPIVERGPPPIPPRESCPDYVAPRSKTTTVTARSDASTRGSSTATAHSQDIARDHLKRGVHMSGIHQTARARTCHMPTNSLISTLPQAIEVHCTPAASSDERPHISTADGTHSRSTPATSAFRRAVALSFTEDSVTLTPTNTMIPYRQLNTTAPVGCLNTSVSLSTESAVTTSAAATPTTSQRGEGSEPMQHPQIPIQLVQFHGRKHKNWYAVIVGRRTGVFDDWLYTNELIKGVPGHTMSGFKTEESAQVHYTANRHLVHVIRTVREDDDNFGPIEDAYDVNWRGYVQGFDIA